MGSCSTPLCLYAPYIQVTHPDVGGGGQLTIFRVLFNPEKTASEKRWKGMGRTDTSFTQVGRKGCRTKASDKVLRLRVTSGFGDGISFHDIREYESYFVFDIIGFQCGSLQHFFRGPVISLYCDLKKHAPPP